MGTERFTREQFEAALPVHTDTGQPLWEHLGIIHGEHQYTVAVEGTNKRIVIRSSVGRDGLAADTGDDSIRLWVEYWYPKAKKWFALGKMDAWTQRTPGWEDRVLEKLRGLYRMALEDSASHMTRRTNGKAGGVERSRKGSGEQGQVAPAKGAPTREDGDTNPSRTALGVDNGVQPADVESERVGVEHSGQSQGEGPVPEMYSPPDSDGLDDPLGFLGGDDTHQGSSSGLDELDADIRDRMLTEGDKPSTNPLDFLEGESSTPLSGGERVDHLPDILGEHGLEYQAEDTLVDTLVDIFEDWATETGTYPNLEQQRMLTAREIAKTASVTKEPNEQQRAAIEAPTDAAVRVLAPPGSGKTFVIARRYAYLLANGAAPDDILAVTFNKSMADELLTRIKRVNPQVEGTAAEHQVSTIHAACYRMLRHREFGDTRRVVKWWELKRAVKDISEKLWPYADERPGWEEIMAWVNTAKAQGLTTVDDLDFFLLAVDTRGHNHGRQLHELRRQLDTRLGREGVLTFADMLLDVETKLQRDTRFREFWQARFKWVIVDEGQDTGGQAMRILSTLASPQDRFFIVGDTDQLLYRFAGATPEANLYDGFEERYPDGLLVKMDVNYRSTREIIDMCQRLIKNNYSTDCGPGTGWVPGQPVYNGPYDWKYLKDVRPRPDAPQGEPITWQMFPDPETEALDVATGIMADLESGRNPGDIFVGARTRAQLGYLEGALLRANVPFVNITGGSFWTMKHIREVLAYTRLAFDEDNTQAFQTVYNIGSNWMAVPWSNSPQYGEYCTHRYLGRQFLESCKDRNTGQPSYRWVRAAVSKRRSWGPGVDDLTGLVQELQSTMAGADSAGELVQAVLDNCYTKWLIHEEGLTADDASENGKLEDLATVVEVASAFVDVGTFFTYVDQCIKAAEAVKDKDWGQYVVISTIHRLKGLEREVVYGIGLSENGQQGLLPHTFSLQPPPQMGILPTGGMSRVEDERCIAFVLVSRAKSQVHLSGVQQYRKQRYQASRFIGEMGLVMGYTQGGEEWMS